MEPNQRLDQSKIIFMTIQKLKEEKKAINDNIKLCEKDIEINFLDDEVEFSEEVVRKIFIKKKKFESQRSEYNSKLKNLMSDLEDCLFGKGDFNKDQLHFPFDSEDPEEYFKKVKKAKIKKREDEEE